MSADVQVVEDLDNTPLYLRKIPYCGFNAEISSQYCSYVPMLGFQEIKTGHFETEDSLLSVNARSLVAPEIWQ